MKPPYPRALLFFLLLPVLFALPLLVISAPTAAQPYLGEWSDGRGDLLVFTAGTIKFGADQAVSITMSLAPRMATPSLSNSCARGS